MKDYSCSITTYLKKFKSDSLEMNPAKYSDDRTRLVTGSARKKFELEKEFKQWKFYNEFSNEE